MSKKALWQLLQHSGKGRYNQRKKEVLFMDNVIVATEYGPVAGLKDGALLHFWGIPYAQPPMGALRFKPPAAPEPWQTPRPAVRRTPAAPQQLSPRANQNRTAFSMNQSEDCLYLNVTTPSAEGKRPVVVTIHGGGNISGSCNEGVYDPTRLVLLSDVVHVGIEFRIGIFGFLYHPRINTRNLNALDILAALDWVQRNIAGFGGDPSNVTLMGFSSGANDIGSLFLEERAMPFHKAMLCSGSLGRCNFTAEQAVRISSGILTSLNLDPDDPNVLRDLQTLSTAQLLDAAYQYARESIPREEWGFLWRPVDDASARLPEKAAREAGAAARRGVSLLIGYASDEQKLIYPENDEASKEETERLYEIPARAYAQAAAQAGGVVWLYKMAWYPAHSPFRACHGIQLPFLYRNVADAASRFRFLPQMPDGEMEALNDLFGRSIEHFFRCGTLEEGWPAYRSEAPVYRLFDGKTNAYTQ